MSFKIESDLNENQIESDVSSYLGYITPLWSKRFRLISVNEQTTGADKLFNRFIPIYLQFKVSQGLDPTANILNRFRRFPLANIVRYRKEHNIEGDPILYFPLRKKAKNASDYQHNILFELNKESNQFALYIAPLTLKYNHYEKLMNNDWYRRFFRFDPFTSDEIEIFDSNTRTNFELGLNPFLRHHISIPPHIKTQTHEHHYSFSKSGGNVVWHGGEIIDDDFRLSNQISKIFNFANNQNDFFYDQYKYLDFINKFQRQIDQNQYSDKNAKNRIIEFTSYLRKVYKIKTMFLSDIKE